MIHRVLFLVKRVHADSLYRNSLYLMASTYIMSFIGFFFWMIVTRLYSTEDVGLATTLISITGLITSFSLFGLNTALIRFLPTARNKNNMINTAFTLIALGTVLVTVIFLTGLPIFSPRLLFILNSPVFVLSFIVFMVIASLNAITDGVFISYRDTKYIPIISTVMSLVKLILPAFLVSLGTFGIFYAVVTSVNVAMVLSIFFLTLVFGYRFIPRLDMGEIRKMWKFSFGNYLAGFFGMLPSMIMPLIITNTLGPKITAYYFMPSMIIALLLAIPRATTQSLFAEGSYSEKELRNKVLQALKIMFGLIIPAVLSIFVFGKNVLLIFGKEYSQEGFLFLQLSSVMTILTIPNYIMGVILNVKHQIRKIIYLNIIGCTISLSFSLLLISKGLTGLGLASILTQFILILVNFLVYRRLKK